MAELNLEYGALDFVLTPDGRFVFLEINPNGQWLWLDDMLSLGITTAVAEWLSGEVE
jgi:D-alanine-D-alanine ligase-like ATP-grasp enzyme